MVIFLHGEDGFLVGRRKRVLMKSFQKKYTDADVFTFDFEDKGVPLEVKRALDACESGLFSSEKMVVFLQPFVLEGASEKLMAEFLKEQSALLPEHTILLFVHVGKIKKTRPLTKLLLGKMDKEEVYDTLAGKALEHLVTKELASFNERVQFDPRALASFLALTGGNVARMIAEMEKLATFKGEGLITKEDIEMFLVGSGENNIWNALDALGCGDRSRAELLFRKESAKSEGVYAIFSMCAWQIRRLLLVREAFDRGIRRPSDIVVATKLPPFTVQKAMTTIERIPLSRLKQGLVLLSDIDTALKQGKSDPEVALDIFVWKF